MHERLPNRGELIDRIKAMRRQVREEIGVAALIAEPTKECDRVVSDLLDNLSELGALLRV